RSAALRALPSFPTRRSSDLRAARLHRVEQRAGGRVLREPHQVFERRLAISGGKHLPELPALCELIEHRFDSLLRRLQRGGVNERSEEHTSELQSRFDLVCRL